jgi:tetratricopeptide (TPR) repeat protein
MDLKIMIPYLVAAAFVNIFQLYRLLPKEYVDKINTRLPYISWIVLALSILILLIGLFIAVKTELEKSKYKFFISPASRTIAPGVNETFTLKITNNNDYPVYEIHLLSLIDKGDLNSDDISIQPVEQKQKVQQEFKSKEGSIIISFDNYAMHIKDKNGRKGLVNIIYDINAHTTKEFIVNIRGNRIKDTSSVTFSIDRYSKEPAKVQSGTGPLDTFDKYLSLGDEHIEKKKYSDAIDYFKKAIELNSRNCKPYYKWGNALKEMNDIEGSISKYELAINIDSQCAPAYWNWGVILIERQRFAEALEKFKKVSEIEHPLKLNGYEAWVNCLMNLKRNDEAKEVCKRVVAQHPDYAPIYFIWGLILKDQRKDEEAIEKFKKVISLNREYKLDAYEMWGAILESQQRYQEAIEKYQKIIDLEPNGKAAEKSANSIREVKSKMR